MLACLGKTLETIKTYQLNESGLPLVIESQDNLKLNTFLDLLKENKNFLQEKLLKHGGLLFRNFSLKTAEHFADCIKALNLGDFLQYIGGDSPRKIVKDGVYTSTEAPPAIKIPLHNELSFVKKFPKHIYFFCETAPLKDGETIIADARKIYQEMPKELVQIFLAKGLLYKSCYYRKSLLIEAINRLQPSHKPWKDVFETNDKQEVEKKCLENDFNFKWHKNDWLEIRQTRPAVIHHPHTNEPVWFNQAHLFDFNPRLLGWLRYLGAKLVYLQKHTRLHQVFFEDGSPIPKRHLYQIMDVLDKNTIYFPWQQGDLLILDNVLSMHGRAPFNGKRRVLAAMTG